MVYGRLRKKLDICTVSPEFYCLHMGYRGSKSLCHKAQDLGPAYGRACAFTYMWSKLRCTLSTLLTWHRSNASVVATELLHKETCLIAYVFCQNSVQLEQPYSQTRAFAGHVKTHWILFYPYWIMGRVFKLCRWAVWPLSSLAAHVTAFISIWSDPITPQPLFKTISTGIQSRIPVC